MKEILEKIIGKPVKDVIKLHGDASYRTYFRAHLQNGETRIVMQLPQGLSSVSEEITNFKGKKDELPFININHFLAGLDLPVPKIEIYNEAEKLMILEDLGDDLFYKFVNVASADVRKKWYKKAIDLLAEMQRRTSMCAEKEKCFAMQRSFDAALLNWEFDHFREYFIEERSGKKMTKEDMLIFETETRKITDEILKIPYCFTHRDFQSRNLMVLKDGSLAMIDYQDALLGPCVYDLVALLRDSYVELEWKLVEKLIDYYCKHNPPSPPFRKGGKEERSPPLKKGGQGGFITSFHLMTLQRKMKDAGRFIYIDRVKKNPNFLQYIPTTLKYIKNAFEQIRGQAPFFRKKVPVPLFNMLKTYVPEFL